MAAKADIVLAFGKGKKSPEEEGDEGEPEYPKAGKDSAMADFLKAVHAHDTKGMTDALESFVEICMDEEEKDESPAEEKAEGEA